MADSALGEQLGRALKGHRGDLTIADAAAKSGLPLRAAEKGLFALLETYPGRLKTTDQGELLFSFPDGLDKPRIEKTWAHRAFTWAKKSFFGVSRFMLRAWISVVLIGYALVFVAILIGLATARQGDDDRRGGGGDFSVVGFMLLRAISEALWWTFHPFSPFATYSVWDDQATRRRKTTKRAEGPSFYEKVNRFVFGPPAIVKDAAEQEKTLIAVIRQNRGRIGIHDVMRATGMTRDVADPLLARLMLDYDGDVEVSDDGGIFYTFPALRKTAGNDVTTANMRPVWFEKLTTPALTGNSFGANATVVLINGFNFVMSLAALGLGLTIDNVQRIIAGIPIPALPADGTAIVLGIIPLIFSAAIFAFPLLRAFSQPKRKAETKAENGRRGLLKVILGEKKGEPLDEETLVRAWKAHAGEEPTSEDITREVVALGGDIDMMESGRALYRFRDLEAEVKALNEERDRAKKSEAHVGHVIFDSGTG